MPDLQEPGKKRYLNPLAAGQAVECGDLFQCQDQSEMSPMRAGRA